VAEWVRAGARGRFDRRRVVSFQPCRGGQRAFEATSRIDPEARQLK
jgi:hypothetical protein